MLEQFTIRTMPGLTTMVVTVRGKELLLLHCPEFVLETPADVLVGVLLHETHHVVLGHFVANPKDFPDQWARTVAEEVTVNEFVKEPLPKDVIKLEQFPKLPPLESTAECYERLQKVRRRFPISPSELVSGSSGQAGEITQGSGDSRQAGENEPGADGARATDGSNRAGDPGQGTALGPPEGLRHTVDDHRPWQEALKDREAAKSTRGDRLRL